MDRHDKNGTAWSKIDPVCNFLKTPRRKDIKFSTFALKNVHLKIGGLKFKTTKSD
jgi:hypothetical protein